MVTMLSWVMNSSIKSGPVQSIARANIPAVLRRRHAKAQSKSSKQPASVVRTRRLSELEPAAVVINSSMVKVRFLSV
jgi:hypothetical protein